MSKQLNGFRNHPRFPKDLLEKINQLREIGKDALKMKRFDDAIQYYSAILNLLEGISGDEAVDLRRRCGLTLAECELKTGNFYQAVARCSEVIDEASNFLQENIIEVESRSENPYKYERKTLTNTTANFPTTEVGSSKLSSKKMASKVDKEQQLLRKSLSAAYFRRAKSLKSLNKKEFACLDLNTAKFFQPQDEKIARELSDLNQYEVNKELIKVKEVDLRDFTEECQVSFPRISLSSKEITNLISASKGSDLNIFGSEIVDGGHNEFSALMESSNSVGSSGFRGNIFGAGLGGLLSPNSSQLKSILGLAGPLLGFDVTTTNRIADIVDAVSKTVRLFKKTARAIMKSRDFIVLGSTILWIISYVLAVVF